MNQQNFGKTELTPILLWDQFLKIRQGFMDAVDELQLILGAGEVSMQSEGPYDCPYHFKDGVWPDADYTRFIGSQAAGTGTERSRVPNSLVRWPDSAPTMPFSICQLRWLFTTPSTPEAIARVGRFLGIVEKGDLRRNALNETGGETLFLLTKSRPIFNRQLVISTWEEGQQLRIAIETLLPVGMVNASGKFHTWLQSFTPEVCGTLALPIGIPGQEVATEILVGDPDITQCYFGLFACREISEKMAVSDPHNALFSSLEGLAKFAEPVTARNHVTTRNHALWFRHVLGALRCWRIGDEGETPPPGGITADEPFWLLRERYRIKAGIYVALPEEFLAEVDPRSIRNTVPYLAIKENNGGKVAFTQNAAAGMADRQQVMKPGRYLSQYGYSGISERTIKNLSEIVQGAGGYRLFQSADADDMARVFQRGPNSCMAYGPLSSRGSFPGGNTRLHVDGEFFHPARCYAYPDNGIEVWWLQLADRIVARTLVNTRTNRHSSIYPKEDGDCQESVTRLREMFKGMLEERGLSYSSAALYEAKIRKVISDCGDYICPYIDPGNVGVQYNDDVFDEDVDYLVVGGSLATNYQTALLDPHPDNYPDNEEDNEEVNYRTCDCCSDNYPEDDGGWCETVNGDVVCEYCTENAYVFVAVVNCPRLSSHSNYAPTESDDLYDLHDSVSRSARLHLNLHTDSVYCEDFSDLEGMGFVLLSRYHEYGDNVVAEAAMCVRDEDSEWLLLDDLDEFGMFLDQEEEEEVARYIRDWACVELLGSDHALIRREEVGALTHRLAERPHDKYPTLPYYARIDSEEENEDEDEEVGHEKVASAS